RGVPESATLHGYEPPTLVSLTRMPNGAPAYQPRVSPGGLADGSAALGIGAARGTPALKERRITFPCNSLPYAPLLQSGVRRMASTQDCVAGAPYPGLVCAAPSERTAQSPGSPQSEQSRQPILMDAIRSA